MTTAKAKKSSEPIQTKVVIIGAGFGGLGMAIQLLKNGIDDFIVLEKDQKIGGTWRDNTYPGCRCDIPSHLYSFSFEANPYWTQLYSGWNEILQYLKDCVSRNNLEKHIRTGQTMTGAKYDSKLLKWMISTESGDAYLTDHFVLAAGPLHIPSIPKPAGIEKFKGKVFHSARWDHSYDFKGKTVVSVGTGASAIQYVPQVAPNVKKLYVIQRSAAWVAIRPENKYSEFRKKIFKYVPVFRKMHRAKIYWKQELGFFSMSHPAFAKFLQKLLTMKIRYEVKNNEIAKKLTPDYTLGCKRILISNDYLPTFRRDNVELLIDSIKEVKSKSVVMKSGKEIPADCIIWGTGFIVDPRKYMHEIDIRGLNNLKLMDAWNRGAEAFKGIHVNGFPNMHMLVGPNTGLGHNSMIFMMESQIHYVIESIKRLKQKSAISLNVKSQSQAEFVSYIQDNLKGTVWTSGCKSWYQQEDGRNVTLWPLQTWKYWLQTRRVKSADYEFLK